MIETFTMFTLGFAIASLLPMVVVPCVHVAQSVSPFRIEASGRYRLRIHKD
jgi:hypothetical protein